MRWLVVLGALAGCGRLGFDSESTCDALADIADDVVPLGHDEDGDGVPDHIDTCPHLDLPQIDGDGDGVGDACDPNPTIARETIRLFATMLPGDQPFSMTGDGEWTQRDDALADARVALGIDVLAVIPGSASGQHQLALAAADQPPLDYVELNEIEASIDYAAITLFDGSSFAPTDFVELATGIHTGAVLVQTTQVVGAGVRLEVGWPGEMYQAQVADDLYQGATRIELNFNNVHFEIRYPIVITSS